MIVESLRRLPPRVWSAAARRSLRIAVAPLTAASATIASAQAAGGTVQTARPEFLLVLSRLDGLAIGLIVAVVAVSALLVWRVTRMVRRETPVTVPTRRFAQAPGDRTDSMDRSTDWGFDQNKRAALARSPVTIQNTRVDLPSLEHAITQWSLSDVQRGGNAGVVPEDTMGKSPAVANSPYRTSFNPYFRHEAPGAAIEVVEVADALLQAELLVQLGDPKQAMTLLSHHIRNTEKPGPAVWLMLLGLYQSTGREAQYNALSSGFKVLFNAAVPPWATGPDPTARDLESYGTAIAKLQAAWGGFDARATIERLLGDDRGGSRQGFSLTAYRELIFLTEIIDALDAMQAEDDERHGIRRKLGAAS